MCGNFGDLVVLLMVVVWGVFVEGWLSPISYLMQNCGSVFKSLVFPAADGGFVHAGGISAVFWVCRSELCDSKL